MLNINSPIFATCQAPSTPSPINEDWIVAGNPRCHADLLSSSGDGTANTFLWDCTSGHFNWFYDVDETLFVIEGTAKIKDESGVVHHAKPGDTVFFPAGSRAEWTVDSYIRKVAFCRAPLPKPILLAKRVLRPLKRLMGRGADAGVMFQAPAIPSRSGFST